jgi:hypothetical protein
VNLADTIAASDRRTTHLDPAIPPFVVHSVDVPDGAVLSVDFRTRPWRHQEGPPGGATWGGSALLEHEGQDDADHEDALE